MDYSEKKIPELKQLCKDRDLSATGKKMILIERLEKYDANQKEEANRFKVVIKTLMGSYYTIYLNRASTILELKQKIEEKNGCPINRQLLLFWEYASGINNEATIILNIRLRTL